MPWGRACTGVLLAVLTLGALAAPAGRDIAWVWPDSPGPLGPVPEAAVVTHTLVLQGQHVKQQPRMTRTMLEATTRVTPVVHVLNTPGTPDTFSPAQHQAIVSAVLREAPLSSSGWVQLDFEALPRQREAYVALVQALRQHLPRRLKLSATALASWCTPGDWLARLPVDELVPMVYGLGPERERWRRLWSASPEALHPKCRGPAIGVSLDEALPEATLQRHTRRYWFHTRRWVGTTYPWFDPKNSPKKQP